METRKIVHLIATSNQSDIGISGIIVHDNGEKIAGHFSSNPSWLKYDLEYYLDDKETYEINNLLYSRPPRALLERIIEKNGVSSVGIHSESDTVVFDPQPAAAHPEPSPDDIIDALVQFCWEQADWDPDIVDCEFELIWKQDLLQAAKERASKL